MSVIVDYKVKNSECINNCIIYEYWDNVLVKKYNTSMRYCGGDIKEFLENSGAKMFWFNFDLELF